MNNIRKWLIKKYNQRVDKKIENYNFLVGLCIENKTLDVDKYSKLMKMIKKKYK